ncbi:Stress responsive A/B Barrel Domain [Aliiroseovarius halocynthiae]|uniref:Dabb family protein n=2 Tax=Aliiroseovarius halocynthiae TaxID=985055 RepID=A0A545SPK3_9RHOB|nr:Dabb family protein [Aliiroseovarius halocynthiae]TQV66891.1 Dabb family protein [Aliiroseovarius halocynthiae]SMR82420.1 Stress responsive A/B Barrel Domain [Aliiroseovarius halocynthiae]
MILHCVFCNFRTDVSEDQRNQVLTALAQFSAGLNGVLGFDHGPNLDFEGKSASYDAGFVIRFADHEALQTYADHPEHQALGRQLCDLCNGGENGIKVFDLKL